METCLICFDDYRIENTKDHQCKEDWFCNACAEYCLLEDGKVTLEKNEVVFTHSAKLCGAQDELTPDEIHLAMVEDVSNIVAKYFPNFDNNIEDQTWSFLVLFIEETIHQLGKETNQMKCDLCETTEKLLTESDKATLRPNWAGVDFYNAICIPCWNSQKDVR